MSGQWKVYFYVYCSPSGICQLEQGRKKTRDTSTRKKSHPSYRCCMRQDQQNWNPFPCHSSNFHQYYLLSYSWPCKVYSSTPLLIIPPLASLPPTELSSEDVRILDSQLQQHLADVSPEDVPIHGMILEDPVGVEECKSNAWENHGFEVVEAVEPESIGLISDCLEQPQECIYLVAT